MDDDASLLDLLRRDLDQMCGEWEMRFTDSGHEALALLAEETADVLVNGIQRPGSDGATLLGEVTERFPSTVRIVLSAQSNCAAALESLGPAHMYLPKPCKPAKLVAAVQRARELQRLMSAGTLRALVGRMTAVPTLPEVYRDVVEELESHETSISRVGEFISRDVGMTAKILQMANSAFFATRHNVADPTKAIVQLGLDVTRALVLSAGIFHVLRVRLHRAAIDRLWSHSLATSLLARQIASLESTDPACVEQAFTGALLHDLGKLVLAANIPNDYARALDLAEARKAPIHVVEREELGASHAEVGAYLTCLWGLPNEIVDAVARHHGPIDAPNGQLPVVAVVHVADFLDQERRRAAVHITAPLDSTFVNTHGIAERLNRWRTVRDAMEFGGGR